MGKVEIESSSPEEFKKGLGNYVKTVAEGLVLTPNPYFSEIKESEEISIEHRGISSVQFCKYTIMLDINFTEMRLNHRSKKDSGNSGVYTQLEVIENKDYFNVVVDIFGMGSKKKEPSDVITIPTKNRGGSWELVLSAISALHKIDPDRFPDLNFILNPQ